MIKQFYVFLLIGMIFFSLKVAAQEVIIKKRNVEKEAFYNKSSTYNSFESRSSAKEKYHHCVKYNFLPFFIGEFPVGYEYKVSPFITIETGLGITTNNYMDQILYATDDFYSTDLNSSLSLSHNAMLKVFPEGNAFNNGIYIGVDYAYRPFSKIIKQDGFNQKATKLFVDIGLVLGYQVRTSERILLDFYVGVSQRHITWDRLSMNYIIDPVTGDLIVGIDINPMEYPTLGVLLGFKLSYLFRFSN
ncbi:MAG: Uncharacterised protein [Owenweeksia sp. TMED14]|nr:MAG: Uncharacterised protein [Owenweeksia sp. TMED14]